MDNQGLSTDFNVKFKLADESTLPKKSRRLEKCIFVCAVAMVSLLSHSVVTFHWLLPYIYVIMTPLLVGIRIVMYWRKRWHYFLLDFCYYANIFCLLFLCIPDNSVLFSITFSLANGPLIWAILVYRNSFVLHSVDKVTSTYIHILPPLLSYVLRWYPEETSTYWFQPFLHKMPELSPIWMYLIPFIAFVIHSAVYALVVNVVFKPKEGVVSSYSYLGDKDDSCLYGLFQCAGPGCRCGMFYVWNWIFCLVTLIGSVLCFQFYVIHCICLVLLSGVAVWNGGSYYVHVFSVRGFVEEIE